jgi:thymidylate synthase (FAD)
MSSQETHSIIKPSPRYEEPYEDVNETEIELQYPEEELVDIMGGCERMTIKVHRKGRVSLVDVMPRLVPKGKTSDFAIVQAARVSYGLGTKKTSEDKGLTRYLKRHDHSTPYEMIELKFHCVMPIFVARQWIRHRTANVNEYSARYSIMPDTFYRPDKNHIKMQSTTNRQGTSDDSVDDMTAEQFMAYLDKVDEDYKMYKDLVDKGLTREQARIGLPVNIYTEWYWKCDLHNIFRFLNLRMESHAQKEIRDYATAMFRLVKKVCPIATEAFLDYQFNAITLTDPEQVAIRNKTSLLEGYSAGETEEYRKKLARLGLVFGDEDKVPPKLKQAPKTSTQEDPTSQ